MPADSHAPVYFILHVPKTAGQTIQYHLAAHCPPQMYLHAERAPFPRALLGAVAGVRHRLSDRVDPSAVRAVAGHGVGRSLEALFPGREIRRIALLREPLSLHLSLYNYRMMNHLAKGVGTYGFDLHLRATASDFIAHWLLMRWLEIPWPRLLAMSEGEKYRRLNAALAGFWFVGDYTDCDRLIAAIAPDLGVSASARSRNTAREWHRQIKWRPLRAEELPTQIRAAVRRENRLDLTLWESWRGAGFAAAAVQPLALPAAPGSAFRGHEALRPIYRIVRSLRRDVAPRLPFAGPRSGLRSGIGRGDRARDADDWAGAARHYRRALSEEPDLPAIWVQYGHMVKQLGDLPAAEAAYREALRREPDNPDTHLQLGQLLRLRGQDGDAAAAFLGALAVDAEFALAVEALEGLGWNRARIAAALGAGPDARRARPSFADEPVSGNPGCE